MIYKYSEFDNLFKNAGPPRQVMRQRLELQADFGDNFLSLHLPI
jgi:hypothetical protein